jgi:hypothetical protein
VGVRYGLGGDAARDGPDEERARGLLARFLGELYWLFHGPGNQAGAGPHRSAEVHANGATTHPAHAEAPGRSRRRCSRPGIVASR